MQPGAHRSAVGCIAVVASFGLLVKPIAAQGCKTSTVSLGTGGAVIGTPAWGGAVSDNGRYVQFVAVEFGVPIGTPHAWVRDEWTGISQRIDVSTAGVLGDDWADAGDLSSDGRFAAFSSNALNLVPGKTYPFEDVFVRDLALGITTPISLGPDGAPSDDHSFGPVLSSDGRFVAFHSYATNLVPVDANGSIADVFVYDRHSSSMTLASVSSAGRQGNSDSWFPAMSDDGRCVAFSSLASNLASNDTNGDWDVFVRDLRTKQTTLITRSLSGGTSPGPSWIDSLSADGRFVVFHSLSSELVPGDTNGVWDAFRHDRRLGTTVRISVDAQGNQLDQDSFGGPQSADGSLVLITSLSDALVPGDGNGAHDAFLIDVTTGSAQLVSATSTGAQGPVGVDSFGRGLSADGRFATFDCSGSFMPPFGVIGVQLRACPQDVSRLGEAKPNSLGCRPWISWAGSPSASAGSGFEIRSQGQRNNVPGLFFYGYQVQWPPVGLPFLLIQPPLHRLPASGSGGSASGVDCTGVLQVDFNAWIAQGSDPGLALGATVYGQFWSRDPGLPPPDDYGLSDAVDLTIGP
jgi:Tol biopolymer transport system component